MSLQPFQQAFLELALSSSALQFGEFTLKSGRVSPYFFNMGVLAQASQVATLGDCYAGAIEHFGLECNVIFGPAYKGIPIATATAIALYQRTSLDTAFAYNRKEAKTHGEGGVIVGQVAQQSVLMVDDVITAGTAARQAISQLRASGATVSTLLVAFDRQEKGQGNISSINELESDFGVKVYSLISLTDLLNYLSTLSDTAQYNELERYRKTYGI